MGSGLRRVTALVTIAVPVLVFGTLGVEVLLATRGPRLAEAPPYNLNRDSSNGDSARVVWLGDSTAAGVGASNEDTALPRLVAVQVLRDAKLTVLATSGARAKDVWADQSPKVARLAPTHVFISVGANDSTHLTSKSTFEKYYRAILSGLPTGVDVTVLGVPDMGATPLFKQPLRAVSGGRGDQLDDVIADLAAEFGARYVDIERETRKDFRGEPDLYFAADKFHPSDEGYQLWANAVIAKFLADEAARING